MGRFWELMTMVAITAAALDLVAGDAIGAVCCAASGWLLLRIPDIT